MDAMADTGTSRSVISADLIKGTTARIINEHINLVNASGIRMKTIGSVQLQVTAPQLGKTIGIDAIVSPSLRNEFLISWRDLVKLGAIPADFPVADASVVRKTSTEDAIAELVATSTDVMGDDLGDSCGAIKGPPMTIHLKKDFEHRPLRVLTARSVPLHYAKAAEALVEELLDAGAIVPVTEPTLFCSPAFFVPKAGTDNISMVMDYKSLNASVDRPVHPLVPASDLVRRMHPDAKFFATLDFKHAYYQVPLDEASSYLTTFLLPFGRFRFTVAPMGLCSSSDEFCRRSDAILSGLTFILKIVDDVLVMANSVEQLLERLKLVLERCREAGIRVSKSKFTYGTSVKFAGFIFSKDGVLPDPDKTAAIRDFPAPTNITELRSFLGLAQQLGHFAPDLSHMASRLRQLLKKGIAFQWLPDHQKDFDAIKAKLCSPVVTKPFDPSLPTELLTDASRCFGIGCALVQREPNGNLRLIHCASQSLTSAQKNYATVELEMMAVAWAIDKCSYYLRGNRSFKVITDHKPLIGIFNKPLADLENARLARFRQRLVDYAFDVEWSPGKDHCIADALSRRPVFAPGDEYDNDDIAQAVCARMITDPAFEPILAAAADDDHYKRLITAVSTNMSPTDNEFAPYRSFWQRLGLQGEAENILVVLDGHKVVVPLAARREILRLLHLPHCGEIKTLTTARQLYYWPGMSNSIRQVTRECQSCQAEQPSQPRLPLQPTVAHSPMEMVALDFFDWSSCQYLVMVDRFSSWCWVKKMRTTTTAATTSVLDIWFREWGYPERIRSDNGPQFRGLFDQWCNDRNILHETSSPYNPSSNGLAEAAVKNMKALLQKCSTSGENFDSALLEWRNTARRDGISPAQAFLGRRQRTQLPCFDTTSFETSFKDSAAARNAAGTARAAAHDAHAHDLPAFNVGDSVRLQNPHTKDWAEVGTVVSQHDFGRSYDIRVNGTVVRRNRRFLKPNTVQADNTNGTDDADPPDVVLPRRSPRLHTDN